jgi:hypothetical protein
MYLPKGQICRTMYLNGLFLIFLPLLCFVLSWMVEVAKGLIAKLDARFLKQAVVDVKWGLFIPNIGCK